MTDVHGEDEGQPAEVPSSPAGDAEPTAGRPWPTPGQDADWWRSTPEVSPAPPSASPEETTLEQPTGPFTLPPRTGAAATPPKQTTAALPGPAQLLPVVPLPPPPPSGAVALPAQRIPEAPLRPGPPRRRLPRRPWFGLPALVVLALTATFCAWVSAEPFWLAVGHGTAGTATIQAAGPEGCRATFVAVRGAFEVSTVELAGAKTCPPGTVVPARMVSEHAARAYAADLSGLNLRWSVGFGLILLCGLAIIWVTGAARFTGWRRATSVGLSLGGPAAIAAAMLAAAF